MKVKLLFSSPIGFIPYAARVSTDSGVPAEEFDFNHIKDEDWRLIRQLVENKHLSVLEHSILIFEVEASRALLQELARHRIGVSMTVQSTRFALKKLNKKDKIDFERTGVKEIDDLIAYFLERAKLLIPKYPNDKIKYVLPEAVKTRLVLTLNLRSLMHLFKLRLDRRALLEFNLLCWDMFRALPKEYKEIVVFDKDIKRLLSWFMKK